MYRGLAKNSIVFTVIFLLFAGVLIVSTPQQTQGAQFILSAWSYPDAEGQGIQAISVYNGSQLLTIWDSNDITVREIESGTNLTLAIYCWLDNGLVFADDFEDAKNKIRHSVIVSTPSNSSVFSQQNFTYVDGNDTSAPLFWYRYDIIIDVPFVDGVSYEVIITYEIYY